MTALRRGGKSSGQLVGTSCRAPVSSLCVRRGCLRPQRTPNIKRQGAARKSEIFRFGLGYAAKRKILGQPAWPYLEPQ